MPEDHIPESNGKRYESDRTIYRQLLHVGTRIYDNPPSDQDSGATEIRLLSPVRVKYTGLDLRAGDDVRLIVINDRNHGVPVGLELHQEVFIKKTDLPRSEEYRIGDVHGVIDEFSTTAMPTKPSATQASFPEIDKIPKKENGGAEYFKKGL